MIPDTLLPTTASSPWAASVIAAGRVTGPLPRYASDDWHALDPADPRHLAAVVVAAECWAHEGRPDVLAERLRDDLALTDQIVVGRIRRASWDVAGARDWQAASHRKTHAELEARRRSAYATPERRSA
jgi:hypothetical protein